jgi:hypothetical protein
MFPLPQALVILFLFPQDLEKQENPGVREEKQDNQDVR